MFPCKYTNPSKLSPSGNAGAQYSLSWILFSFAEIKEKGDY